jgi:uncharacterized membrane protein
MQDLAEIDSPRHQEMTPLKKLLRVMVLVVPVLIVGLGVVAPPWSVLDKAHLVGYGICHQIPERTFFFNGTPMPLCARCSGTYLGALVGFAGLLILGRRRVGQLPPTRVVIVLAGFIVLMGIDGLNSYLSFFPNAPQLYEPRNLFRLTTGLLNGLALSLIVYPVFNVTLWREVEQRRSIETIWELAWFLPGIILIVLIVESGAWFLLYPLSILSAGGVLILLTMVNSMIALILTRRESMALGWGDAIVPILWGLAASFLELGAMIIFRAVMTERMGLPF